MLMSMDLAKVILKNVTFMAKYSQETLNRIYRLGNPFWKLMGLDDDAWNKLDAAFKQGDYTPEATRERQRRAAIELNSGDDILAALGNPDLYDYESDDDAAKQQTVDFINRLQTLDQRKYDAQLTREARQYDSPQSQLARLMATGLSRDAALSMVSGGTGVGVQNTAQPVQMDASMFPSQTELNKVQAVTSSIGAACQFVNMALGAASFGISLPSMLNANSISHSQSRILGAQVSAMDDIGKISAFATEAIRSGSVKTDSLVDRDSFISTMDGIYKDNPDYQGSMNSLLSNPYGAQMLDNFVNQNFSTKRPRMTAAMVDAATNAALADYMASQVNLDLLTKSKSKMQAEIDRIVAETKTIDESRDSIVAGLNLQNELTGAQKANVEAATSLTQKQVSVAEEQRLQLEQENYIRSWTCQFYDVNGDDYNEAQALQLTVRLNQLNAATTEEAKKAVFDSIINNDKLSACLSAISLVNADASKQFLDENPEMSPLLGLVETTDWLPLYQTYFQQNQASKEFELKKVSSHSEAASRGYVSDVAYRNAMRTAGSLGLNPNGIFDTILP